MKTKHKKIYISLVLLFGFFVFVPRITKADIIVPIEEMEENIKELKCLYSKKAKLSRKYNGNNIKVAEKKDPWGSTSSFTNISYHIDPKYNGLRDIIKSDVSNCSEYVYITTTGIYYGENLVEELSRAIQVENDGDLIFQGIFDVTAVPFGSFLEFDPNLQELKVLPPTKESYEESIQGFKEHLKKEEREIESRKKEKEEYKIRREIFRLESERKAAQEKQDSQEKLIKKQKTKNKIFTFIFVLGIIAIISIFIKEIFKKFGK